MSSLPRLDAKHSCLHAFHLTEGGGIPAWDHIRTIARQLANEIGREGTPPKCFKLRSCVVPVDLDVRQERGVNNLTSIRARVMQCSCMRKPPVPQHSTAWWVLQRLHATHDRLDDFALKSNEANILSIIRNAFEELIELEVEAWRTLKPTSRIGQCKKALERTPTRFALLSAKLIPYSVRTQTNSWRQPRTSST